MNHIQQAWTDYKIKVLPKQTTIRHTEEYIEEFLVK